MHCKNGHERNAENSYINNRGHVICRTCSKNNRKEWIKNNPGFIAQRNKKSREGYKLQVFEHYSKGDTKCKCCGNRYIPHLTMDHIEGGGADHRREMGSGSQIYTWIRMNNFPEGYQILCWNCNSAKHIHGSCGCQNQP